MNMVTATGRAVTKASQPERDAMPAPREADSLARSMATRASALRGRRRAGLGRFVRRGRCGCAGQCGSCAELAFELDFGAVLELAVADHHDFLAQRERAAVDRLGTTKALA